MLRQYWDLVLLLAGVGWNLFDFLILQSELFKLLYLSNSITNYHLLIKVIELPITLKIISIIFLTARGTAQNISEILPQYSLQYVVARL